jgi:hypothetical protein
MLKVSLASVYPMIERIRSVPTTEAEAGAPVRVEAVASKHAIHIGRQHKVLSVSNQSTQIAVRAVRRQLEATGVDVGGQVAPLESLAGPVVKSNELIVTLSYVERERVEINAVR